MVAPVVPGVNRQWTRRTPSSNGGSIQTWEFSQTGQRQKKPYTLPLPATMHSFGVVQSARTGYNPVTPSMDSGSAYTVRHDWETNPSDYEQAFNKAYARFKDKVGTSASVGTTLAEYKQSVSMIAQRALQLYEFQRRLRQHDFDGAARALGQAAAPKSLRRYKYGKIPRFDRGKRLKPRGLRKKPLDLRPGGKDLGNTWLEYYFGWAPLIGDIYNAVDVLQREIPPDKIKVSASVKQKSSTIIEEGYSSSSTVSNYTVSAKIGAYITVTNPNLLVANQLGLVNPAVIAWELVPFSFLVDWFVNVKDVLSSCTDLFGLTLSSAYHTKFSRSDWKRIDTYTYPGYEYNNSRQAACVRFQRVLGIGQGPTLKLLPPKHLSVTRGATAISLLLQSIRG